MLRSLQPHGLIRLLDWRKRFANIGLVGLNRNLWPLQEAARQDLLKSRIELLPFKVFDILNCVIDVGANEGQWSLAVRRFLNIKKHVLFEPNPIVFQHFLQNLPTSHNGVEVFNQAVGRDPSRNVKLNITRGSSLSSILPVADNQLSWHGKQAEIEGIVEVPMIRLDDLNIPYSEVDILKIDVQGFEREVFEGAREVLKRTKALLVELDFESHYQGDMVYYDMASYVEKELGFRFWDMSPPERRSDGRALWADACFVNKGLLEVST